MKAEINRMKSREGRTLAKACAKLMEMPHEEREVRKKSGKATLLASYHAASTKKGWHVAKFVRYGYPIAPGRTKSGEKVKDLPLEEDDQQAEETMMVWEENTGYTITEKKWRGARPGGILEYVRKKTGTEGEGVEAGNVLNREAYAKIMGGGIIGTVSLEIDHEQWLANEDSRRHGLELDDIIDGQKIEGWSSVRIEWKTRKNKEGRKLEGAEKLFGKIAGMAGIRPRARMENVGGRRRVLDALNLTEVITIPNSEVKKTKGMRFVPGSVAKRFHKELKEWIMSETIRETLGG